MKPPPLLLGVALLFWGWRANMFWLGVAGGLLLELSHVVRGRWEFSDSEFNRLWDVCTVIFVGAAAYLRFSEDVTSAAYKFFEWMPLIFYPMALGYIFSTRELVPMKAFSWLLRRKGAQGADRGVAFGWLYLVVCLVASGATNVQDIWFFVGSSGLIAWALWVNRPRRLHAAAWCALFVVIAGLAFYAQSRLVEVQAFFENKISEFIVRFGGRRDFDPNQAQTSMGRIGSLKQSGAVVMKVKPEQGPVPARILECTYGRLDGNIWKTGGARGSYDAVNVEPDGTTWTIWSNAPVRGAVRIIERVNRKSALLAVPFGTKQLRELSAGSVETNRNGVIRIKDSPGMLNFTARFGSVDASNAWDGVSRWNDDYDEEALRTIIEEMAIDDLADTEKIKAIPKFFETKFRYTTYQQARQLGLHGSTPLSDFLLKTRAGHCEYFATATVLLLRHYGIPARYATGYAVQEVARDENAYIIRERHGHAWAVANVNGEWVEVDSTPAGWAEAEASEFSAFQDLEDAWSSFTFGFLEWRWLGDWSVFRQSAPWLVVPLTLFLVWRIFGRRMSRETPSLREAQLWPGADSEFFKLERRLAKAGLARQNGETTDDWLQRVGGDAPETEELLKKIVRLHQKYRFGSAALEAGEREQLRTTVTLCLERIGKLV